MFAALLAVAASSAPYPVNAQERSCLRNSSAFQSKLLTAGLRLRHAEAKDREAIKTFVSEVRVRMGLRPDRTANNDPLFADLENFDRNFQGESGCFYFLVDQNNRIQGTAAFSRKSSTEAQTCQLKKLYLAEDQRGKGMGGAFLGSVIQSASETGYTRIELQTDRRLEDAIHLYEKNGFTPFWPEGIDQAGATRYFALDLGKLK